MDAAPTPLLDLPGEHKVQVESQLTAHSRRPDTSATPQSPYWPAAHGLKHSTVEPASLMSFPPLDAELPLIVRSIIMTSEFWIYVPPP